MSRGEFQLRMGLTHSLGSPEGLRPRKPALRRLMGIPLIVNTSSGIMNTDAGHREHSPERSDGLASQFIPSESRFSLF